MKAALHSWEKSGGPCALLLNPNRNLFLNPPSLPAVRAGLRIGLRLRPGGRRKAAGFLLMECLLAVLILGLGVAALSRCVENCMRAERIRREEVLAQRVLANYFTQIETGALPLADNMVEDLKGAWTGMTMRITREQLKLQNEKEQELFGLYKVTLDVGWQSGREVIHRDLSFVFYPKQQ